MSEKWFFTRADDGEVELRARFEGGGMVGDVINRVPPGWEGFGTSHKELHDAGAGVLIIEEGCTRIVPTDDKPTEEELDTSDLDDLEELIDGLAAGQK